MAYIVNKPVRFDRDYAIGEIIPEELIDSKMRKRLISWGKILYIEDRNGDPDNGETIQDKSGDEEARASNKKNSSKKR